jgi:ABC-type transport system involved in multi-copper enzyme maturation permease subunit
VSVTAPDLTAPTAAAPPNRARVWRRQIGAMLALELRKTFLRWRALPVVAVAFLPPTLLLMRVVAVTLTGARQLPAAEMATQYAALFQLFFVRLVVFFVCFTVFTYLVRGEIAERSLHFYLMAPLRRDVFLAGKYVAGLIAASSIALMSLVLQLPLAFAVGGVTEGGAAYLFEGPGAGHAVAYALVTVLAVAGYGAVFLALALAVRNPMIPAGLILGWEWINFLLPAALKRISIIHYLQSLCPVPFDGGPFALPAEPTPAPLAIGGLLLLTAALLYLAIRRARRLEVLYTGE